MGTLVVHISGGGYERILIQRYQVFYRITQCNVFWHSKFAVGDFIYIGERNDLPVLSAVTPRVEWYVGLCGQCKAYLPSYRCLVLGVLAYGRFQRMQVLPVVYSGSSGP